MTATQHNILLDVQGLRTAFHTEAGAWLAVDGVDFRLRRGEILGLVGESGSGKSVTGFSLLGLIDPPGEVIAGSVVFDGEDLRGYDEERMRSLRGRRIAMIFQDPLMTLNPVLRIEEQMLEAILRPWSWLASPRQKNACAATRTNFLAACVSAWRLRLPCSITPTLSFAMNRPQRWMSPFKGRFSTACRKFAATKGRR